MPYIKPEDRERIDKRVELLSAEVCSTDISKAIGQLNYACTMLLQDFVHNHGGLKYSTIASITGVLKNVSDEFYRRMVVPYEEEKKEENGDVYYEQR